HDVGPQPLRALERVRHRRRTGRIDGLELVDEAYDARELRGHVAGLGRGDLEPGQTAELGDVFWREHGIGSELGRKVESGGQFAVSGGAQCSVIDFSLNYTRRL